MAEARKTFDFVMELEVGGTLHTVPGDPGGTTKWGFAQRKNPDVDVAGLDEEGAFVLFCEKFWRPLKLDRVNSQLMADQIAQMAFNTGHPPAILAAQRSCNRVYRALGGRHRITVDGQIGPQTIEALNGLGDRGGEFEALWSDRFRLEQIRCYSRLRPELVRRFIRGWINRAMAGDHG
jgi:lysozyme family protein